MLKICITKICGVLGEGEERKLAQLLGLGFIQLGEVAGEYIVGVSTIAEDLKEGEVRRVFFRGGESLDLRG